MKLRAVRDLQVKYSLIVRLNLFDDDELKVALLKEFVCNRWDANASCMWLKASTKSLLYSNWQLESKGGTQRNPPFFRPLRKEKSITES